MSEDSRCPTCRVPWRAVMTCPRCGTDLAILMQVAARAWELREAARRALRLGDQTAEALRLAQAACRLHATPWGRRLLVLAFLAAGRVSDAGAILEKMHEGEPPESYGATVD